MKKILYVDMDNVLVDFKSAVAQLPDNIKQAYAYRLDEIPGIFLVMLPIENAIDSFIELSKLYDTYILSTAPWENPSAWTDKLLWVKRYLGQAACKRLIITHHKDLNRGDFLVDDRKKNGAERFTGELILFGSPRFPDWPAVVNYLRGKK